MDDTKVTTNNKKFICGECQNENTVSADAQVGDVIECEFCGIEYRIVEKLDNGEYVLEILEEEK